MKKDEKKREFDLSQLSLKELIKVYTEINNFLKYLRENGIEIEEAKDE